MYDVGYIICPGETVTLTANIFIDITVNSLPSSKLMISDLKTEVVFGQTSDSNGVCNNDQCGDSMDLKDQFRYLVGGYFGVTYMDEYPLKEFVLKDIENYIRDFIEINPIDDFDYVLESEKVKDEVSVLVKLQDSLLVLNKINADMDLVLLVKRKIKSMK